MKTSDKLRIVRLVKEHHPKLKDKREEEILDMIEEVINYFIALHSVKTMPFVVTLGIVFTFYKDEDGISRVKLSIDPKLLDKTNQYNQNGLYD